jgi:hypothetical protein
MKITITHYDTTHSVEINNDAVNAFEAFEYVRNLLKQVYSAENIDDAICDVAFNLGAVWPNEESDERFEKYESYEDESQQKLNFN